MIVDFLGQGGFKGGLVILMCSVHIVGYRVQPEVILQVEVSPQCVVVPQFEVDPQIEVLPNVRFPSNGNLVTRSEQILGAANWIGSTRDRSPKKM
jgi:hypothetical protein